MKFFESLKTKGQILKKMWLNQFAFSLFGLFVATPFTGNICIFTGVFSLLFYIFVVGFAVLDDSQKDRISYTAGRKQELSKFTGFVYSLVAFLPTIIINIVYLFTSFFVPSENSFRFILGLIIKYALCGEILGIDIGLTKYEFDAVNLIRVSDASESILFMSDHAIFQLIFVVVSALIFGIIYYLGFTGIVNVNTTETKKKKNW